MLGFGKCLLFSTHFVKDLIFLAMEMEKRRNEGKKKGKKRKELDNMEALGPLFMGI